MEKTGCRIICGAPTTLAVNGFMMMMMSQHNPLNAAPLSPQTDRYTHTQHTHTQMHTHAHLTHMRACIHTHTCMHACILNTHTHACTCTYTHTTVITYLHPSTTKNFIGSMLKRFIPLVYKIMHNHQLKDICYPVIIHSNPVHITLSFTGIKFICIHLTQTN